MIFTIRFISDEEEDFIMDVNVLSSQTFEQLHLLIQNALKFDNAQLASFFVSNENWEKLDEMLRMNCFHVNPSINSCLKFFRKTPWAREKIEKLYINFRKNQTK